MSLFSKKETVTLSVQGMHCPKCVARVNEALLNGDGVTDVQVSLEKESAVVEGRGMDAAALAAAVTQIGFPSEVR